MLINILSEIVDIPSKKNKERNHDRGSFEAYTRVSCWFINITIVLTKKSITGHIYLWINPDTTIKYPIY